MLQGINHHICGNLWCGIVQGAIEQGSVSLVLLAGGVGKRMGVCRQCAL